MTLAITGYDDIEIIYLKTNGNALDIGTSLNASDVVHLGVTSAEFKPPSPEFGIPFATNELDVFLRIAPGLLPHTHTELRSSKFTFSTAPDHVVIVTDGGSALNTTTVDHDTVNLKLQFACLPQKQFPTTVVTVRCV